MTFGYKFSLLRFSVLLLVAAFVNAQASFGQEAPPVFDWQSTIGGTSYDAAAKIIHSVDGGYIIVGYTYSTDCDVQGNHGSGDALVVKIDASGNKQWQKALGGSSVDGAMAVVEFPDGKIYVAANTNSSDGNITSNHGAADIWIICLGQNGNIIWQKTYGGLDDDYVKALIRTSDDHLLIGGNSQSFDGDLMTNHGSDDYWLVKTDTLGNMQWQKAFGGSASDMCNALVETNDGGYVAVGSSGSVNGDVTGNHGNIDFWAIKTDINGNLQWQKSLGGSSNESALSVIKNTDGDIVMGGYTNSNNGDVTDNRGGSDFWMVILDSTGSLIRQITYGGSNSDVAYSVIQEDDGGYLLSGGTFSYDFDIPQIHGSEDFCLVKTDPVGNLKWSRAFGGTFADRNKSVLQTPDGGCIMAGYTYSNNEQVGGNHGSSDVWVVKLSCLAPVSSFTFADDTVCINSVINLKNTSLHSAAYSWLANGIPFGNNDDANFQFNSAGTYTISLLASTCYANNTSSQVFTVIDHPVPLISSTKPYICEGETITLSTPDGDNLLWNTGDTTASIQITAGGDYWVATSDHQCPGSSAVFNVPKYALPKFSLGSDTTFCFGNVFSLKAPEGYPVYNWQDGSANSYFDAVNSGEYFVTVYDGHCSFTDTVHLIAKTDCIFPVAEFFAGSGMLCKNACINYVDLSANVDSWDWHFQGGIPSSSTNQNPSNICYNTPGTYSVSLTVSNVNGSVTQIKYITVYELPPTPVITLNGFLLESTPASSYQWFSNGQPIAGATNRDYAADFSGYYYVKIANEAGCFSFSDSLYFDITGITGISNSNTIEVYPNPANDQFTVYSLQLTNDARMEMYDALGKKVYSTVLNSKQQTVNCKLFSSGVYLMHLESKNGSTFRKLVISH